MSHKKKKKQCHSLHTMSHFESSFFDITKSTFEKLSVRMSTNSLWSEIVNTLVLRDMILDYLPLPENVALLFHFMKMHDNGYWRRRLNRLDEIELSECQQNCCK